VRDQIFVGRDLAEALAAAGRTLGLAAESLRYVVIDGPSRGTASPEVRIAILMERPGASAPAGRDDDGPDRVRQALEALVEATGAELSAELIEDAAAVEVRLSGPGATALLEDGEETVRALDHLLRKMLQIGGDDRRFLLSCAGQGDVREAALRERAQELARAVLSDGQARETEPLNAYERRIVHLALSDVADVRTVGVGEGSERRVAIEPAAARADADGDR
jgi:spoIIIJ-associated protein